MTLQKKFKTCKQCGEQKDIKDFRPYYNNPGHYKLCKECEAINNKYKYLQRKMINETLNEDDEIAYRVISEWYEMLKEQGLQPPRYGEGHDGKSVVKNLQGRLDSYRDFKTRHMDTAPRDVEIPEQLNIWLTQELNNYTPDHLQNVIYEELRSTWSPRIGYDEVTKLPVYDDQYRHILLRILERFNEYEDLYDANLEENND